MVTKRRIILSGLIALLLCGGVMVRWRHRHGAASRWVERGPVTHDPTGIVIHHSDTPGIVHGQYVGATFLARSHARRGFAVRYRGRLYHIGYHYVIREDGLIEPGRPEHCPGAHSKWHNDTLGICLVGNFSPQHNPHFWTPSQPTEAQLRSLVWLCGRLMAKYHLPPERVMRHCDLRETACPGDRFPFAWLQSQLSAASGARTARGLVGHRRGSGI